MGSFPMAPGCHVLSGAPWVGGRMCCWTALLMGQDDSLVLCSPRLRKLVMAVYVALCIAVLCFGHRLSTGHTCILVIFLCARPAALDNLCPEVALPIAGIKLIFWVVTHCGAAPGMGAGLRALACFCELLSWVTSRRCPPVWTFEATAALLALLDASSPLNAVAPGVALLFVRAAGA